MYGIQADLGAQERNRGVQGFHLCPFGAEMSFRLGDQPLQHWWRDNDAVAEYPAEDVDLAVSESLQAVTQKTY